MSSILKALKKLEGETEEIVNIQPLSQQLDTKKVIKKRSEKLVWLQRMVVSLGAFLIIATGGWMLFGHKYVLNDDEGEVSLGFSPSTENKQEKRYVQPQQDETGRPFPGTDRKADIISSLETNDLSNKSLLPGQKLKTGEREGEGKIFYSDGNRSEVAEKAKERSINNVSKQSTSDTANNYQVPDREKRSLQRLDDSTMRLQAITWSNNPHDRFVLINNVIVREGESVNGYSIDRIFEDYVEVRKGGEQWIIEFRLR